MLMCAVFVCAQIKKTQLVARMLASKMNKGVPSYWGVAYEDVPAKTMDNWLIDMADLLAWTFDADGRVTNDAKLVPGDEVRLFPLLTNKKASACHSIALKAWKRAHATGEARNWSHANEFKGIVNKMVYAVQVPTVNGLVWSTPFPSNYGLKDDTPGNERVQDVQKAPQDVQDMFSLLLRGIATNLGFGSVAQWLETEGNTVYHFTINVMGSHTLWHHDELVSDAPGPSIFNTCLAHAGMFAVISSIPGDKDEPIRGCWNMPGDCIGFKGGVRMYCEHAVNREFPLGTRPNSHARTYTHARHAPCYMTQDAFNTLFVYFVGKHGMPPGPTILTPETVLDTARFVATIRVGLPAHDLLVDWWKFWSKRYNIKVPAEYKRKGGKRRDAQKKDKPDTIIQQ